MIHMGTHFCINIVATAHLFWNNKEPELLPNLLSKFSSLSVPITLAGIACIIMREVYATMGESIHPNPSSLSRDFLEASRRLLRT